MTRNCTEATIKAHARTHARAHAHVLAARAPRPATSHIGDLRVIRLISFFKSGNEFTLHTPNNRKGSSEKPKEAPPKKSAGGCEFRRSHRVSAAGRSHQNAFARPRASLRREKALPASARPRPGCVGGATVRVRARAGAAAPPARRAPPPLAPISSPHIPPRGARCWTRSEGRRSDSGLSAAGTASTSIAS